MATKDGARIQEVTNISGTGSITLIGAPTGYATFASQIASGSSIYYWLFDANGVDWECGKGVLTGTTLTRATVIDSSTGAKISLSAGNHTVTHGPVPGFATGDVTFDYNKLIEAVIKDYREEVRANGSGSTLTIDPEGGNVVTAAPSSALTLALPGAFTSNGACSITVLVTVPSSGTLTLPTVAANFKWVNNAVPTPSTTAGKINEFTFRTLDGTNWLGNYIGYY